MNKKYLLIFGAALLVSGIAVYFLLRKKTVEPEDLAPETKPTIA